MRPNNNLKCIGVVSLTSQIPYFRSLKKFKGKMSPLPTSTLAGIAKFKCTSGVKVAFTLFLLTLGDEARLSTQALLLD